ncbi:MAG: response regulator [Candidatus Rokubacteria bacterium]|nr:response regulator [Candidatus Rokubacteria bacterium]
MESETRDRLSGLRVLVVEDLAVIRQLIRLMLESEGATVVEACTGREAFELAATQTFDVALTDLGLPDMPGAAVINRILSASHGRTPVAVVSGAHEADLAHALEVGAERAFSKPMDWDEIIRYLARRTKARAVRNATPARRRPT